jgi:hypothetical protein
MLGKNTLQASSLADELRRSRIFQHDEKRVSLRTHQQFYANYERWPQSIAGVRWGSVERSTMLMLVQCTIGVILQRQTDYAGARHWLLSFSIDGQTPVHLLFWLTLH